ncbi:hypothetical protein [Hungatella sp.]|uniref:hypothetical protein n=1 Tax=Hungatella sp. TaxID=2613924 RepID=UPI003990F2E7
MKVWRNIVIIVSAMLFGLWFGFQINRYREIKENMEMAELLIDKERNYFMECYKHIENPDYDPHLGFSTVYNFHNGVLTVEEQDIKYRFEADNMTIRFWMKDYIELPWFFKLKKKYKKIYEKYQLYESEYSNLMEKL